MSNILKAIINLREGINTTLTESASGKNRMNNMGEGLEIYIKDIFSNSLNETSDTQKKENYSKTFSYLGNANNPPDMILKSGDAIEVKKLENSRSADLALNSSYPKNKLHYDDPKITKACRDSEAWDIKDIIYVIGFLKNKEPANLFFVYGDCYAANQETYKRIGKSIKSGITNIDSVNFADTKELGRVNKVDPLGITNLRIRGMWTITNPFKLFSDIYKVPENKKFTCCCLMRTSKFDEFSNKDKMLINTFDDITVVDVKVQNPDNPAVLINSKLIKMEIDQ